MTAMTEEFKQALIRADVKACVALLDGGADIEAKDVAGWTALHYASRGGHTEACLTLLERGADVKSQDKNGRTALHCAAIYGYVDVCITFLDRGVDLQAKDTEGFTAIGRAEKKHPETANAIRAWLCRKQARAAISDLVVAPITSRVSP